MDSLNKISLVPKFICEKSYNLALFSSRFNNVFSKVLISFVSSLLLLRLNWRTVNNFFFRTKNIFHDLFQDFFQIFRFSRFSMTHMNPIIFKTVSYILVDSYIITNLNYEKRLPLIAYFKTKIWKNMLSQIQTNYDYYIKRKKIWIF